MHQVSSLKTCAALVWALPLLSVAVAQDAPSAADLPAAESILDRYIEATGGVEAYEAIESSISKGTMEIIAAGLTGQLEVYARPAMTYTKVELPGVGAIESGVRDGIAWENSALTGPRILMGAEAAYTVMNASPNAPIHWREIYSELETEGTEDVRGEPAYRVLLTTVDGLLLTSFYSVDSGLLLRTQLTLQTQLGPIPVELNFDEYMEHGGVLAPAKTLANQAGTQIVLSIVSAEVNAEIPDERFALPEPIQALLQPQ
ncbi:MAG: hypothetical protein ACWGPN_18090 [Gammaproteobacteria bacterium]